MTLEEKNRIIRLREAGQGYSAIAATLGISKETVKSFCQRNNLGGRRVHSEKNNHGYVCPYCEKKIRQSEHCKPRRFCSDKCRQSWWNAHPEFVRKKAVYDFICARCGRHFTAYGNSQRKYCCHECYVAARFNGDRNHDVRTA